MHLTVAHVFATDEETYWEKIFPDAAFNRALFVDLLKFPAYQVAEVRPSASGWCRRVLVTPPQDAPPAVQKLVGSALSYTEEGTFDRASHTYRFKVITSAMQDRIRIEGSFRTTAQPNRTITRTVDMDVEVKIFGVGGMVESFLGKSMLDSYTSAAEFTNRWIRERGL